MFAAASRIPEPTVAHQTLPALRQTGRAPSRRAAASTTDVPASRATQTGQNTPEVPAFRRNTKKTPNDRPAAIPYPSPRAEPWWLPGRLTTRSPPAPACPAAGVTGLAGLAPCKLTSPTAARHAITPV